MCGITGIIAKKGKLEQELVQVVEAMNLAMNHRGPDSIGNYHDTHCALAMNRLSIIDLAGGDQPIFNESGEKLVFQNGEIYNYRQLRKELESKGHQFRTLSDTEVLVHLYEEYGTKMCDKLQGMFAFCIYDKVCHTLFIGRDRFGEKPLYYWHNQEKMAFSSELSSLLSFRKIPRKLDLEALDYFLRTSLIPEPLTLFEGVVILPAGHWLLLQRGELEVTKYFEPNFADPDITSLEEAKALVEPTLVKAVKDQIVSDVPLGAFLSGGIDSSAMVALLQQQSHKPIQTFNIRFEDQAYDESPIARKVAEHCGTEHHELTIPDAEFTEDIFWKIIDHMGQPFRDSSAIPTYFVTKAISEHVKVAVSGDGGDEQFAGYDLFQWYLRIRSMQKIPKPLRKFLQDTTGLLKESGAFSGSSKLRQVQRALDATMDSEDFMAIALNEMFTTLEMSQLLNKPTFDLARTDRFSRLRQYPDSSESWSPLRKIMYYRIQHTLPANMLVKVDRMSMANSLEVRAPFLDSVLAAQAARLSDPLLLSGKTGKYALREIMKPHLPSEVFDHPKQGFNLPLHRYQNETYRSLAKRLLFEENPLPELFKADALRQLYNTGLETEKDSSSISIFKASHQLWMIMQLLGWAKKFEVSLK